MKNRIPLGRLQHIRATALIFCFSHPFGFALAQQNPLELPSAPDFKARIEGEVLDAVTHQPVSDVRVFETSTCAFPCGGPSKVTTTDANGRFYFDGLYGGSDYNSNSLTRVTLTLARAT